MKRALTIAIFLAAVAASAEDGVDRAVTATGKEGARVPGVKSSHCASAAIVYNTTHASTQGAEITAAANGAACSMGDRIVLGGTNRFLCGIQIEVFTLASLTPFDLTMRLFTDCSTSGGSATACGDGPGTLIASSTVLVTGITPPSLGEIFAVNFEYPNLDLTGEVDSTITVSINASRSDVFWRIGETVAVGSQPAGEPGTSFVERCGSTGANNGCSRNFGITNNFAIQVSANSVAPVDLQSFEAE